MILLLSHAGDPMLARVMPHLARRGARVLAVDDADLPAGGAISVSTGPTGLRRALRLGGQTHDLSEVHAAWDHRPGRPTADPRVSRPSARAFVEHDTGHLMDDLWHTLPAAWFPASKAVVLRAQHKATQLRLASRLGFAIPPTLFTNDPAAARAFCREHGGRTISKTFWMAIAEAESPDQANYQCFTQVVSNRSLAELGSLRACPVILQAHVPKAVELRVTVVGRQVLAAQIASQQNHRTRLDLRHEDLHHTRYTAVELPAPVAARVVALVEALGLRFGTIDLIRTPEGEHVFLEINPSGQWRWVEQLTGLPIAEAIADWLVTADRAGGVVA